MSNDAKFWAARIGLVAFILAFGAVVTQATTELVKSGSGEPAHVALWLTLFFVLIIVAMPLGLVYQHLKNKRWQESAGKTQNQVAVETLSKLAEEQQKEKRSKRVNKS